MKTAFNVAAVGGLLITGLALTGGAGATMGLVGQGLTNVGGLFL